MTLETNENNQDYIDLLNYEIEMFYITVKELGKKPRKEENKRKQTAIFEAFLLHTRILIDFFLEKDGHNDSIKLKDIIGEKESDDLKQKSEYTALKELFLVKKDNNDFCLRERLHKCLAHLSGKRNLYLNEKKWDTEKMVATIINLIHRFKENNPTIPIKYWIPDFGPLCTVATPHFGELRIHTDIEELKK